MRARSTAQKGLAAALAVAVLAAVPARMLVDVSTPPDRAQVESSHDPARCGYLHDHAACQQLFASAASPAPASGTDATPPPASDRTTSAAAEPSERRTPTSTLPRAPPHPGS